MTNVELAVPKIVLASASPRRRDIFEALGIPCTILSADIDEESIPYKTPREFAIKVAFAKACAVDRMVVPPAILIAADTIVVLEDKVYGKPKSTAEARQMLGELSGRKHRVISGIAVKEAGKISAMLDADETGVHIREISEAEIAEYVDSGEPMDKAGAYAAQGLGRRFISQFDGDYFNVVGLPVGLMLNTLDHFLDTSPYRANLGNLVGFDKRQNG